MATELPTYTREEVAKHVTKNDGWFIIHNNVINAAAFFDDHPGGRDLILQGLGKDVTEDFDGNNHSKMAHKRLAELVIGRLPKDEQSKEYSLADLKGKNTRECAWIVIHNKVYDIKEFLDQHPGGRDILLVHAGTDATKAFEGNNHSPNAKKILSNYLIGDLNPEEHVDYDVEKHRNGVNGTNIGKDENALPEGFSRSGDDSLLYRLQEQIKLFLLIAGFVLAGIFLLS